MPPAAAWIAGALFAVHPVHVEVVANVVGQAELLAALAVTLGVIWYLDHRASLDTRAIIVLVACYAAGLLAKEHAAVLPALLVAAELTVIDDPRPLSVRWPSLRPVAGALVLTFVSYVAVRLLVLHGRFGEATFIPLVRAAWTTRWWTALGVVPQWVRLLVWPAHLVATYSPPAVPIRRGPDAAAVAGLGLSLALLLLVVVARRRLPAPMFALAWIGICLLPVCNLLVPSGVLLAERSLFLPSVGAALALGVTLAAIRPRPLAMVAVGLLLAAGVIRSATRAPVWRDNASLFAHGVIDAPDASLTHFLYGKELFSDGQPGAGAAELREAIALSPDNPGFRTVLAWRYLQANRCDAAMPLFRGALAIWPAYYDARSGLATCLMRAHAYREARSLALVALAQGGYTSFFRALLASADSAQRADATTAVHGSKSGI
jgi:hypothetical protein